LSVSEERYLLISFKWISGFRDLKKKNHCIYRAFLCFSKKKYFKLIIENRAQKFMVVDNITRPAQENHIQTRKTYLLLTPSNAELNPICHLLTLFGDHHILHISR